MKKILLCVMYFMIIFLSLFLIFCIFVLPRHRMGRYPDNNAKPDDVVSCAIDEVINSEDTHYQGKETTSDGVTYYQYLIIHQKSRQLKPLVSAVNSLLQDGEIDGKINLDIWISLPGAIERTAQLTNYSDSSLEAPDYNALQGLMISGGPGATVYADPSAFISLQDIRSLQIHRDMQMRAENQSIDWYEIWPELENVEVFYVEDGIEMRYNIEKDDNHEPDEEDELNDAL